MGSSSSSILGAFPLSFSHRFEVGPEVREGGRDLFVAGREVLIQCFSACCDPLVEMERLDLQRDTALDVLEAEVSGRRMARLDDVEEVGVGV